MTSQSRGEDEAAQSSTTLGVGQSKSYQPSSTEGDSEEHRIHEFIPPFLVKTKTRQEKEDMRNQYHLRHIHRNPYQVLYSFYSFISASAILENTASVARDHLANERTFLAWLRTSLSLITVGVAITQLYHLVPQGEAHQQQGRAIGATFIIFSIVFLGFGNARYFHSQVAMTKGQFPASRGAIVIGSICVLSTLIAMFIVILMS